MLNWIEADNGWINLDNIDRILVKDRSIIFHKLGDARTYQQVGAIDLKSRSEEERQQVLTKLKDIIDLQTF